MAKALVTIREIKRPVSRERIGYRICAAVPNENLSFRKPYLIAESSDYTEIAPSIVSRFLAKLAWHGYTEFAAIGDI